MISVTAKFLWLLDTFHFNISALDQHQSLFWRFCERLTCTMAMIQHSDHVILSGIELSGKYSTVPVWAKRFFISVAASLPALWLKMILNPFYCISQGRSWIYQWNLFFNENFCPQCNVEVAWWHEASLHKLLRRHVGWCESGSLMPF